MPPAEDGKEELEAGWYRDRDTLEREYREHRSFSAIAAAHGGNDTTYQKWAQRLGIAVDGRGSKPSGGYVATDRDLELTVKQLGDIKRLLEARGLNPDEWVVIRAVVNTWDSVAEGSPLPLQQLKVTLRPRLDVLLKPAEPKPQAKVRPVKLAKAGSKPRLVVFVGDEQAPYHDETLTGLFCRWLERNKPDEGVHVGDLMDLPTISRHRPNPVWSASVQECVQAGYDLLAAYRAASPDTVWRALPGNHDERIRDYQLQRAPDLFGVRPADLDDRELRAVLTLPSLLHFDALGFEWLGGDADYEHAQVDVSPELVARHGFVTGANSAEKTVRRLGINVVVGHTHRQVITYVTEERMRETLNMVCVETGCMCRIDGGLGYAVNPNWQNGFATANVWPDGSFTIDHATYRAGALTWRDQRFTP